MRDAIRGTRFQVPAIVFPNLHWLGDNVLLEPVARCSSVRDKTYVLSRYPELFDGHPVVAGISDVNDIPEKAHIIDINKGMSGVEKDAEGRYIILPDKNRRMWKAAGFDHVIDHPRLYLTSTEIQDAKRMKRWFNKPCVGVVLRTRHRAKDWAYMMLFIRALLKHNVAVCIFAKGVDQKTLACIPAGAYYYLDRSIREVMQGLHMMDVVVAPDTGLAHISASLGTETIVICFKMFADLYEMYPSVTILANDRFTMSRGITGIAAKTVLKEVDSHLLGNSNAIPVSIPKNVNEKHELMFVRFRGIGDVLLALPALATYKKLYPNTNITFMTSPGVGLLIENSNVLDDVVRLQYNHSTSGLPLAPRNYDYEDYDSVVNAINAIDFLPESSEIDRPSLFGALLELDAVDYTTDWKLEIPKAWLELAQNTLSSLGVSGKVICLQADSKGLSRIWPALRQREFIGAASKKGFTVVVVSDKESEYPGSAINLTGKLSFSEYVGMIGVADILLGADSGGLHIAGVTDQLALGLFGSVSPDLRINHYDTVRSITGKDKCVPCNDWQHSNCRNEKRSPMCMWSIKHDRVLNTIETMLKEAKEDKTNGQEKRR